jgi:hypothetical protein
MVWVGQALHGHGVEQHGGWAHFFKPRFHEDKGTKSIDNPHWPNFSYACLEFFQFGYIAFLCNNLWLEWQPNATWGAWFHPMRIYMLLTHMWANSTCLCNVS